MSSWQQLVMSVYSSTWIAKPNFEALIPSVTWSAISTDISLIRRFAVSFESDTLSNFATSFSPIRFQTSIFALARQATQLWYEPSYFGPLKGQLHMMLLQPLPSFCSSDQSDLSVASSHSHQVSQNNSRFYPYQDGSTRWHFSKLGFLAPFERVFVQTTHWGR